MLNFFRVSPWKTRTLALDEGSRTSASLARILLSERFGITPFSESLAIGSGLEATNADAVLLIGDRAIGSPHERFEAVWDLGNEWVGFSGLPFVFAMWVARQDVETESLAMVLAETRNRGEANLAAIAAAESASHGLTVPQCLTYLRDNLHYHFGPQERLGLSTFYRYSTSLGLGRPLDLIVNSPQKGFFLDTRASKDSHERSLLEEHFAFIMTALDSILSQTLDGQRLHGPDAVTLLHSANLASLGRAADTVTRRLHPENFRTYNIDRNINYTNICTAVCDFCAFYRAPRHPEGYLLDRGELLRKIEETLALGGDQILMQGGLHPRCRWSGTRNSFVTSRRIFHRSTFTAFHHLRFITSQRFRIDRFAKCWNVWRLPVLEAFQEEVVKSSLIEFAAP